MKRLHTAHVRQAQRFVRPPETFDPLWPAEERSEAERDRYAEFAQDARDDARIDHESEEA